MLAVCLAATPAVAADTPTLGQIVVTPGNPRWFSYHQMGSFFMAGPGDPEDFLYRGTLNPDGTRSGDQMALIEKLAPTGANSIFFAAVGSDLGDQTHNPFIDHDPKKGLNRKVLDQWETWFAEMDRHGIVIFFIFYNDAVEIWRTGDVVGPEERAFLHEIVDRFEHHKHLIWVVAEEYEERYTPLRASRIAAEIRAADDHGHPVAIHKLPAADFAEFADDPNLDQYALQTWAWTAHRNHQHVQTLWNEADGRYNLNLAEGRDWGTGQAARQKAWAAAMAGAYVMAYEMDIANTAVADMEDLGRLRSFMERSDFQNMEPRDDLAAGDTAYVMTRVGRSYIAYAPQGTGTIGIRDFVAGTYRLRWLDTATGNEVVQDHLSLGAGTQAWPRPAGIGQEVAVYALRLDGENDPPLAHDRTVSTVETVPVSVFLAATDPDGPGPYLYTIVAPPLFGTLSGSPPDLAYTADPGFVGDDAFTWIVHDGRDDSNLATMAVAVAANVPPVARDARLVTGDHPVSLSLAAYVEDPDGPGPYTYSILTQPENGELAGAGADWTYTPDPGFVGIDSFTWSVHDGFDESAPGTVTVQVVSALLADDFERPDSATVGNGWRELEDVGTTLISAGQLVFDSVDEPYRPLVDRSFQPQAAGQMIWTFDLDFVRSGPEKNYAFYMQLGSAAGMSDTVPAEAGVAVNLIWGSLSLGLATHQGFGYVVDGVVTHLATVSGRQSVRVEVDVDLRTYRVEVAGVSSGAVPFDESVSIDTVRFFTHGIDRKNFSSRRIDDVVVSGSPDDGVNDPPVAFDASVSTVETAPVGVTLQFSDPDGPGPYVYTIVTPPGAGTLSGTAPDLTYTADPGFVGEDSFTWKVNDGEADSNLATAGITVLANVAPTALDSEVSTVTDTPVSLSLADDVDDPDGPGPHTYTILTLPAHGSLAGSGPDWTYEPNPGFTGTDSFTWKVHDGLADSNGATVTVQVVGALFADDFERPDSGFVGNGWRELEGAGPALIAGGHLVFDAVDESYRPLVDHSFPQQGSGQVSWSFDLDFARSGSEKTYSFHMQLGLASAMSDTLPTEAGVAVNLIWGSLTAGLATHEGLGYVVDGAVTQLATVSGRQAVRVEADLDLRTYRVEVAGNSTGPIPFDENVAIDTVRFFAHGLHRKNFSSRRIDNVVVSGSPDDGVNDPPVAFDAAVSTVETTPVDITLQFSDPDGPGPYVYTIVSPPASGALSGTAPDLTYTADAGFVGGDGFTWKVNDGEADSNLATVGISVLANGPPVALDSEVSTVTDTPVSLSLAADVEDPDGPGPYTYTILTGPGSGSLAGSGPDWTYTPNPGFTGTDSFTWKVHDGLADSNAATVTLQVVGALFADDFERPDSAIVGNGWRELEDQGPVVITGGHLVFDAVDEAYRPLVSHPVPLRASGRIVWTFALDFARSGREKDYAFHMQLGLASSMSDTQPAEAGVAVNLVWGSPSGGLATHEGLGYVVNGVVTQVATVSGRQSVQVEVDLDARTYRVTVAGQTRGDVPFDESVAIDTVRFFAHGLNRKNFGSRRIDNVLLSDS